MVNYKALVRLCLDYGLVESLLLWAGIFRYLNARHSEGFTMQQWRELDCSSADLEVVVTLFRIFEESGLLQHEGKTYRVTNDSEVQRALEIVQVASLASDYTGKTKEKMLWTISSQQVIPTKISSSFMHLNTWIQELIQTAQHRLILFAPYYTQAGIRHLSTSLNALFDFQKDVKIDWIVGNLSENSNRQAFSFLFERVVNTIDRRKNVRVFEPSDVQKLWFHAKLLLVDGNKGYMGSANYSHSAFHGQFELGVPLAEDQVTTLAGLIHYWIDRGILEETKI